MFGKLFGKKKSQKPQSFAEAKDLLIESISEESSNKHLAKNFDYCVEFFEEDSSRLRDLAESVFPLIVSLPIAQAALAMSICASLIERGYRDEEFIDKVVHVYIDCLTEAMPFFKLLEERVKIAEEGHDYANTDIEVLYKVLINDRNLVPENVGEPARRVEAFSWNIIAILSISPSYIAKYKSQLKDDISTAMVCYPVCYWVLVLLEILFEEPIVVIDVDNQVGFEGKMSGVSDNFQLQYLLMGMSELNEQPAINENDLSVANGSGIHISNSILVGKWNMYTHEILNQEDWQEIKVGPAKTFELQDFWIMGKDTPMDIPMHDGKRVILLGRCSNKQPAKLQRTFKNMKASVAVDKILTEEEINSILGL